MSLVAFVLSMMSFDLKELPEHFSERLPRKWIAGLLVFVAAFLALAWLGRLVPPMIQGQTPALENGTTMVIQAMDLGLVVPLALLAGVLLLKRSPWGYLLASVAVLKFVTMGLAVSSMSIVMASRGVPEELGIMVPFLGITLINLIMAVILLRHVNEGEGGPISATTPL